MTPTAKLRLIIAYSYLGRQIIETVWAKDDADADRIIAHYQSTSVCSYISVRERAWWVTP